MASHYLRGKVYWISYRKDGKLIQYSLKTKDKVIARTRKKEIELDLEKGYAKIPTRKRTIEFFTEYKEYSRTEKSLDTYKHEVGRLTQFIKATPLLLKDINVGHIKKFLLTVTQNGAKSRTRNHYLKHIKTFLNYAKDCNYIYHNPALSVKRLIEEKYLPRFLSEAELARLKQAAKNSHLYPIIMTGLYTGMRIGEILQLKWEDISDTITIHKTKSKTPRVIPLNSHLKAVLGPLREKKGLCFTYKGKSYAEQPKTAFLRILKVAKIRDAGWHTLRKTFASYAIMKGVPITKIAKWLGHTDPKLTYSTYAHLAPRMDDEVEKLSF